MTFNPDQYVGPNKDIMVIYLPLHFIKFRLYEISRESLNRFGSWMAVLYRFVSSPAPHAAGCLPEKQTMAIAPQKSSSFIMDFISI